ncbi:putative transporter-like protein [Hapsidospora chrysogenum ATCC 11550]|uniref:Putative transporter-like protein n=1 Tax=Hapsidospora chrysogenum (strain ATCC 11550 / CBS 779.69 / DSM 880 / IAM 14645 / JCM 23072 / IMI 49137) TaxID=857340 RepID=A0A086SX00_HAPC1|nr:putative transporter-like protein [Hapsidospora chrysogenum ATCC 11550]
MSSSTTSSTIQLTELPAAHTSAAATTSTTRTTTATAAEHTAAPSTTTTAAAGIITQRRRGDRAADPPEDEDEDDILQQSRAADLAVPDGGYGWVVVASGAVILWWSVGLTYAWGIMQAALADDGLASPAVLSFVGSLQAALVSVLAIVCARVMRWLGARRTVLMAVVFMAGSEILASFTVRNVGGLFVTSGVLMGIGVRYVGREKSYSSGCLSFMVVTAIPAQYFSRRRGLATGLMFAGSGFGGAANSFMLDALITALGTAWAYRILGIATLATGLPAAWMLKERTNNTVARRGFVEWRLFKSLSFNLVFIGSAIGTFPLYVPPFFIPMYAKSLGLPSSVGASLVAGFSLASAFGRIGSGIACDKLGSLNTLIVSLAITAVTMLAVWPASTTLAPLVVFVAVNGAANGAFFSTMPTAVSNIFGSARVSIAMSMVLTGWVGGYLMGAPIAGFLLQAYGGAEGGLQAYRPAMFYAGSLALVSAALIVAARFRLSLSLFARL